MIHNSAARLLNRAKDQIFNDLPEKIHLAESMSSSQITLLADLAPTYFIQSFLTILF